MPMQWLRRSFIAGCFVMVPLIITVAALVWAFQLIDGVMAPLYIRWIGREIPGLGLLTTLAILLGGGGLATNVLGKRLLQRGESYLPRLPVLRTVYATVKQLVAAFSPENEMAFKRVVLVDDEQNGYVLGFLTKEFTLDQGSGDEPLLAVYVPTNHLYLGDVRIFPKRRARYPDLTVQEGGPYLSYGRHGGQPCAAGGDRGVRGRCGSARRVGDEVRPGTMRPGAGDRRLTAAAGDCYVAGFVSGAEEAP